MSTQKATKAKAYTQSLADDLRSFLENPPEPPANRLSLTELFEIIRPQAVALIKAGYTVDQLKNFLSAKNLPVTTPEAIKFLRSIAPKTRTRSKRLKREPAGDSVEAKNAETPNQSHAEAQQVAVENDTPSV
jgi:hypothetical protein